MPWRLAVYFRDQHMLQALFERPGINDLPGASEALTDLC